MPEATNDGCQSLTDFVTLFAHLWYRDFPLHPSFRATAEKADWTMHVGITVRTTADLMGMFTHFESGGKTDAVLRDRNSNPIAAVEWENERLQKDEKKLNEFRKLMDRCKQLPAIRFACFLCYQIVGGNAADASLPNKINAAAECRRQYSRDWAATQPLLLVVVQYRWDWSPAGRRFTRIEFDKVMREGQTKRLREQPAYPWDVAGSRWSVANGVQTREGEQYEPPDSRNRT